MAGEREARKFNQNLQFNQNLKGVSRVGAEPRATAGPAVTCEAPAKINLYLHVTGRRADGYHLLDSLFVFPRFGDRVEVRESSGFRLHVDGPFADRVPGGDDNLVLRAARAMADEFGLGGADMRLSKAVPVAAGLGGGSADAAATLRGLARMAGIDSGNARVRALANDLGADVLACLVGGALQVSGIGGEVRAVSGLPELPLILVNPGRPVSTAAVFHGLAAAATPFSGPAPLDRTDLGVGGLTGLVAALAERRNDLEGPAVALAPEIGPVLDELRRLDGCLLARMSGSGATCFALCASIEAAERGARRLHRRHAGWWVVATSCDAI